ncbi:RNA polymerase sigma-54 factor [Pararhodobacter aggregans]|uniref:RNA polymerase factor sigma-54 n=1 Tax=Pararhodobacter aggregans TaxID=404875 RepID=UPI003A8FA061
MALNPRLELRQQQRLALTPDVRLRLNMLRMGPGELADELAREAARNPFLLLDRPASRPSAPFEGLDIDAQARSAPFQEDLRLQIERMDLPRGIAALALFLIAELGPDGFLDTDLEVLADEQGIDTERLEQALAALHRCDPPGIGARTVTECLSLQLVDKGLGRDEAAATLRLLPLFARRDWARIGRELGLDPAGAEARAALLKGLTPRPALPAAEPEVEAAPLLPDLRLVRGDGGSLSIEPADTSRPRLRLDAAMVHKAASEGFAPELLVRARALLAALEQRGHTLARIGDWLADHQAGFFQQGIAGLLPATRQDLAGALGLHPSTVGRALAGKAIDIDGRLWPLGVLFSTGLPTTEGVVSSRVVQRRIAELIAAEPHGRPLSDESLAGLLREQGVDIARRTVAKYRQGLRIPGTATRRRMAAARHRD